MRRLLRAEPAAIAGFVTALLAAAVAFGFDLDPEQVAALGAVIAAGFALARALVFAPDTAADMAWEAARNTAVALSRDTAGAAGSLTAGGERIVGRIVETVTGGLYSPGGSEGDAKEPPA
jgi:hypothetical protein